MNSNKSLVARGITASNSGLLKAIDKDQINRLVNNHTIPKLPIDDFVKFNEIIGLPKHPATLIPSPLLPHQIIIRNTVREHHRTIVNKSRKIGSTETHLRIIAEGCYNQYMGHNGIIVFGNRQNEANRKLDEFDTLFHNPWTDLNNKKWTYGDLVMSKKANRMELYSGVTIETYPAEPTALRGPSNVKFVLFSETAHINRLSDIAVYTAVHPLMANDDTADFMLESTPNGKRGFFHNLFVGENEYTKLEFPYQVAMGTLLTEKFIESEKYNQEIDFEQEYCCKFTTTYGSVFKDTDIQTYIPQQVTDFSDII